MELPWSPAVWIWWKLSLLSRPVTWTMSRLRSASSSSLTPAPSLRTYRCLEASRTFSSMAWFILSMEFWQSFITSIRPKPAGLSSSWNSTSKTKGYLPWS